MNSSTLLSNVFLISYLEECRTLAMKYFMIFGQISEDVISKLELVRLKTKKKLSINILLNKSYYSNYQHFRKNKTLLKISFIRKP